MKCGYNRSAHFVPVSEVDLHNQTGDFRLDMSALARPLEALRYFYSMQSPIDYCAARHPTGAYSTKPSAQGGSS